MVITGKFGAEMVRLIAGAAFLCTFIGCTGPLIYRPEKKEVPVIMVPTKTGNRLPTPPDRKTNNATLAGIDSTGLGIRDDVLIWIYSNYTATKKRTILTGMGRNYQELLVNPAKTKEEAQKFKGSFDLALLGLKAVPGIRSSEAEDMDALLYEGTVNTPARLKVFLRYYILLGR